MDTNCNCCVCLFSLSSWLRYCATSRKVAGSIPDEVFGFFNLPNPSSRTMVLGVKGGRPACKADNLTAICEPIV
jgi:hypothetical protein